MATFHRQTIIITGASQGIGAATARLLATEGANLMLVARSEIVLQELASEISQNVSIVPGDVAQYKTLERAVESALRSFGAVHAIINNAGIIDPIEYLANSDPSAWSKVVDVNLKGVYHGIRAVLPSMLERQQGTIVNISSGAATSALEGWSHYCATKAAVLSLTRCAHKEYASKGIRVVGLSPGTVATEMQTSISTSGINPVSQLNWSAHIPPDWVARAIAYLFTEAADDLLGGDFSLKTDEGRARVGLPNTA